MGDLVGSALGIAATTCLITVVNAVILRSLPLRRATRIQPVVVLRAGS